MRAPSFGSVARTSARLGILVALGAVLFFAIRSPTWTSAAPTRQADPEAALRELSERLLAPPHPAEHVQIQAVEMFPAALPPDLAIDFPLPPGGRFVGSARFIRQIGVSTVAVLDAPLSTEETLAFYQRELPSRGWALPSGARPGLFSGGFQSAFPPISSYFCRGTADPWLDVTVLARDARFTDVRISVQEISGGLNPCNPQPPHSPPGPIQLLPPLPAPPGLDVRFTGGQAGPDRWTMQAAIETDTSPAELEAHYAGLLQAGGWTRRAGDAQPSVAWSTWDVPREGPWSGFLYVLETSGQDRRTVYVQMETADSPPGVQSPAPPRDPVPTVSTAVPGPPVPPAGPVPTAPRAR